MDKRPQGLSVVEAAMIKEFKKNAKAIADGNDPLEKKGALAEYAANLPVPDICAVHECLNAVYVKRLCRKHYDMQYRR